MAPCPILFLFWTRRWTVLQSWYVRSGDIIVKLFDSALRRSTGFPY